MAAVFVCFPLNYAFARVFFLMKGARRGKGVIIHDAFKRVGTVIFDRSRRGGKMMRRDIDTQVVTFHPPYIYWDGHHGWRSS